MMDKSKIYRSVSALELLQVALVVLKLCRVIKWRWIWVSAPTWIPVVLYVLGFFVYLALTWGGPKK